MKLLYITNGITGSGGLERVLSVKAPLLSEKFRYEVHLLGLNEIGKDPFFSFSNKVQQHSIAVSGNPLQYFLQYKKGIQKVVDEIQPDLISVCDDGMKGFLLPGIVSTKAKWIHESHASLLLGNRGNGVPFLKKVQHQFKQFLGKRFSKIVLLTEGNRKEWQLNNLVVIPNPAPFETTQFSSLQNKRIIAVGSYSFNKGYDLLLNIWSKIEKDFPDWELHVYGRNTHENLYQKAEKLNLERIHFHNPVPHIENKYLESSIFVLPSRSEGFGMVIVEAMSCGLPVVSFDCPHGPKDIITDGKDGFLIENGNIEEFAGKLQILMNDFERRKKMGEAGRETAKKYLPEIIIKQWDELFRTLIKNKEIPRSSE